MVDGRWPGMVSGIPEPGGLIPQRLRAESEQLILFQQFIGKYGCRGLGGQRYEKAGVSELAAGQIFRGAGLVEVGDGVAG